MPGAVLGVGVLASFAAITIGLAVVSGATVASARASAGADTAALAAADATSGAVSGESCDRAKVVAEANGARLIACAIDGFTATVTVEIRFGAVVATGRARAGPPP